MVLSPGDLIGIDSAAGFWKANLFCVGKTNKSVILNAGDLFTFCVFASSNGFSYEFLTVSDVTLLII